MLIVTLIFIGNPNQRKEIPLYDICTSIFGWWYWQLLTKPFHWANTFPVTYSSSETVFSLPCSKCCNLISWWSVKILWSWHFEVPRRYFLTLDMQQSKRCNANNGLRIVARKASPLTCIFEQKQPLCHCMFSIILFNSTNYGLLRQREICSGPCPVSWCNYHELDKVFLSLTLVFDLCKTKQIYLVRDNCIMTLDSNQNLIFLCCPSPREDWWRHTQFAGYYRTLPTYS